MNYQNYASFDNRPPYYKNELEAQYDEGSGVIPISESNMTVQDIFRTPFLFLQEHHKNYNNMANTVLRGIESNSDLEKLFFSDENIKRVQKLIKKEIIKKTNGQFRLDVDQEHRDMIIVMRAVFLEYGRFLPNQIVRQVKRLNQIVVQQVVPGMITEIKQEYGYLREINKPLSPIPRPMNVNNAGRRTLPSISTIWELK